MWENKVSRIIYICLLTIFGVVLLTYEYGVLVSSKYYYPGTKINGFEAGFKEVSDLENEMYENPSDYVYNLAFRDETYMLNGYDIGLKIDYSDELERIKREQNPFLWFNTFFKNENSINKTISFDEEKLEYMIDGFDCMDPDNMIAPENATIQLGDDGVVVAVDGDPGTIIEDKQKIYDYVGEAIINDTKDIDIEECNCYKVADYTSESSKVKKCVDNCNAVAGLDIRYLYGTEEVPLEPFQLFGTIIISDTYDTIISKNRVKTVLEGFSRLHDTYDKLRRFRNHDRQMITIDNSHYGWMLDVETETDNLYSDLIHHKSITRAPEFLEKGYTYDVNTGDDIGSTYAEVNVEKQIMYFYKNGRMLMYSDVVTGCVSARHSTPHGIYSIDYKQSPAVLRGEDYESKVTYWMPFNGGIGFHDATWRGRFGGEIYQYSGSHGCVNMPFPKAQELFSEVEEGVPVIVY